MAAVGTRNVWLAGMTGTQTSTPKPLVQHWNGRAWRTVVTPPGLSTPSAPFLSPVVAASSASDAWVIGTAAAGTPYSIALRWNGSRWARFRFPDWSSVNSAAVFSRTDAWAFGVIYVGKTGPFVSRYNGSRWHAMRVPVVPYDASAVSAGDIWAAGQTASTFGHGRAAFAAMHWNGRSWHTVPLPRLRLPKGVSVNQTFVQAFGASSAWVACGLAKGEGVYPGDVLLHWTGRKWHQVKVPFPTSGVDGITQDGHGGIWLSGHGAGPKYQAVLYHDRGGHWSRQPVPVEPGEISQLSSLSWSSGANSGWAAGETVTGETTTQGELLRYAR